MGDDLEVLAMPVDSVGRGVVRKRVDLTADERQYLLAVERGDCPSVQQCLVRAKVRLLLPSYYLQRG